MHRWFSILGTMILVLMLWTGGAAHAAKGFDCVPASAEAAEYSNGNQDQVPSSPDQGVAHHHSGCNGDHFAAPSSMTSIDVRADDEEVSLAWREFGVPGNGPKARLRPPMA